VPRSENAELYKKYQALAETTPNVYFAGRLATYKYYNMDQVVAQALALYTKVTTAEEAVIQTSDITGARDVKQSGNGHSGSPRSKRRHMDDIIKS
jgi:UDP-galactopyranose mutase